MWLANILNNSFEILKVKTITLKGEVEEYTITGRDFNTSLSVIERTSSPKHPLMKRRPK